MVTLGITTICMTAQPLYATKGATGIDRLAPLQYPKITCMWHGGLIRQETMKSCSERLLMAVRSSI